MHRDNFTFYIQNTGRPHAVLQLPEVMPHLGPLKAALRMSLVRGWPSSPRITWKG